MELPTQLVTDLGQGVAHSFASWPNSVVPNFGAGFTPSGIKTAALFTSACRDEG